MSIDHESEQIRPANLAALGGCPSALDLMRLPRFRYVILLAVIVGGVLPLLIMVGLWLHIFSFAGERLFYFWPSSVLLMAMQPGHTAQVFSVVGLSIAINVLLYLVVLTIFWSFGWIFRRWRVSLRDGTTI